MNNITASASKIAFLALTLSACVAFVVEVVLGRIVFEAKDFMLLAAAASAYYFSYKGSGGGNPPPTATTGGELGLPLAGK